MVKQVQNQDVSPNCNWRSLQNVEVCLLLLDLITDLQWLLSEQLQTEAQPKLGLCSRLHSVSAEAWTKHNTDAHEAWTVANAHTHKHT